MSIAHERLVSRVQVLLVWYPGASPLGLNPACARRAAVTPPPHPRGSHAAALCVPLYCCWAHTSQQL